MKVTLLSRDALPMMLENAVLGALTCTGNEGKIKEYEPIGFLKELIKRGHESVIEHINLTFCIEGISRALLQELARHRHISLSVKSTRYMLRKGIQDEDYRRFVSESITNILDIVTSKHPDTELEELGLSSPIEVASDFSEIFGRHERFKYADIIKYFIPEFFPTSLVMTTNARELRHILKLRSMPEALHEFRCLTKSLYDTIPEDYRPLFLDCLHEEVLGFNGEAGA